jgi:uncharacterized protein (TIGR00661 family)
VREEVKRLRAGEDDFILGYLLDAGFATQVVAWHRRHPRVPLRVFWNGEGAEDGALSFHPLDGAAFLDCMSRCRGYASTGGFESICEAMYLGKPAMMVPAHAEQELNAFDAARAGAGIVARGFDELSSLLDYLPHHAPDPRFRTWVARADELFMAALEERLLLRGDDVAGVLEGLQVK